MLRELVDVLRGAMVGARVAWAGRSHATSDLKNPAAWLLEAFGARRTAAGVDVTPATALEAVPFFAAVRNICEDLGSLPFLLYRRTGDRSRERARDHPLYSVLHDVPNPEMDSLQFVETMQAHATLRPCAYAEVVRSEVDGSIEELWPLHPDRVHPLRRNGERLYRVDLPEGERGPNGEPWTYLFDDQVFRLRSISLDGWDGLSMVQLGRQSLGLTIALELYGAEFFGNDATPGGFFEHPGEMGEAAQKRFLESIEKKHQGLGKKHRFQILEEGMKFSKSALQNDHAQFLESRRYQVEEAARLARIPLHMIGAMDRATFCLPAGTDVMTPKGPRPIETVSAGDEVWSREGATWVKSRVLRSGCTGEDQILRIRTTNRTLRANAKHRLLVRRKHACPKGGVGGYQAVAWRDEWIPAGDLRAGDTVVCMDRLPEQATSRRTPTRYASVGFMEFCGLLLGDGNVQKGHGVSIARAATATYMDHYRGVMRSEFMRYDGGNGRGDNTVVALAPVTLSEDERSTRFASVLAAAELERLGLAGTARTKAVPAWVFDLAEDLRLAFLRGFLDADGAVDKLGRASFSSCNRTLLSGIRHLAMGCGLPVTNLRCQRGVTRLPNGRQIEFEQWSFTCSDPGANRRIGSHDSRYVKRLAEGKPFGRKGRAYPRHGGRGAALAGVSLSRIVSITTEAAEPVYDLEVAGTHCFVADGLVVHNSNIEHQGIDYVVHTIRPRAVRWERAITQQLLTPKERRDYYARFLLDALMRGDLKSRFDAYAVGRQWGFLSANDICEMEERNPLPAGGDIYLEPENMRPAGKWAPKSGPDQNRVARAFEGLFAAAFDRCLRKEASAVERAAKRTLAEFEPWARTFFDAHQADVREALEPVVDGLVRLTHAEHEDMADYAALLAQRYTRSALDELAEDVRGNTQQPEAAIRKWAEGRRAQAAVVGRRECERALRLFALGSERAA